MISPELVERMNDWPNEGFHAYAGEEIPDIPDALRVGLSTTWNGSPASLPAFPNGEPSSSITTGHTPMLIAGSHAGAKSSSRYRLRTTRPILRDPTVPGLQPVGQLVSRVGDGDVPGPEEDDCKGHVPLLAAESEKRNFLSGRSDLGIGYTVFYGRISTIVPFGANLSISSISWSVTAIHPFVQSTPV